MVHVKKTPRYCSISYSENYALLFQPDHDEQWSRAMEFVNAVSELNYMTQIVIMMYEDPTKVGPASWCFLEAK